MAKEVQEGMAATAHETEKVNNEREIYENQLELFLELKNNGNEICP